MKVAGRSKDGKGDMKGSHDLNPFLNTFTYDFEFSDDGIKECLDDVIAKMFGHKQMKMVVKRQSWILLLIAQMIEM